MYYQLTDCFEVTANLDATWAFFSDAENLPRITPPKLAFQIVTDRPIHIQNDSLLDYTIRWAGVPVKWRTRIIDWQPPYTFIDLQIRGPYTLWHHQHRFTSIDGGTRCEDRVIYKLPGGWIGRAVHHAFVRRQLLEIFRFRRNAIRESLGWKRAILEDVEIGKL